MDQYSSFAYVYDRLMADVDYSEWVMYIEELFKSEGLAPKKILELACGTGNITIPLSLKGYDVTASDISEDMLMVAADKAAEAQARILFLQQDMRELELEEESFDTVLCLCDGMNYIVEDAELLKVFSFVHRLLRPEGAFIFDISSYYKLKKVLGNNTFGENLGDLCYLWENYFDEDANTVEMDLTFFIEENTLFKKMEEFHLQRAYQVEEIIGLLNKAGFIDISVLEAFGFNPPNKESERIFFKIKK